MVSRHLGEHLRTNCVKKIIEAFKYQKYMKLIEFVRK